MRPRLLFSCFLFLAALSPGRAEGTFAPLGGDPATAVTRPDAAPGMGVLDYPPAAYTALGSSFAVSGRFERLGWTEAQLDAFLGGIRAALEGRPFPMDQSAQELAGELARRMAGAPQEAGASREYPAAAYSAFGSSFAISAHFAELGWSEGELGAFLEGIKAATGGHPVAMDDMARRLVAEMGRRVAEAEQPGGAAVDPKVRLARYFKGMRRRLGLQVADSGLGYNVQTGRNGIRPRPGDWIVFSCVATTADGRTRIPQLCTERIRVRMEGLLPGLMEGLQMMTVGSTAVFVVPPSLSFGEGAWPEGVEHGSPLVYYIALGDASPP